MVFQVKPSLYEFAEVRGGFKDASCELNIVLVSIGGVQNVLFSFVEVCVG